MSCFFLLGKYRKIFGDVLVIIHMCITENNELILYKFIKQIKQNKKKTEKKQ